MTDILAFIYVAAVAALSLYGALGLFTLWLHWRHRHDSLPCPTVSAEQWPSVTVQLPIYNERYVVERLVTSAVALDYPRDRLQIQVIDDSTDDTAEIAAALVERYRAQGINIVLCHRDNRDGYKAGALAVATISAEGEYLAVFDADFQPDPDFLRRTMPYFVANERLGMIQTRWGHLNANDSALTAAQAIAIDKHFVMEQGVRHRARIYPKFNGAAGIWRRTCLEDAGGWQDDTVCEDLDLSTRAVLRGWEFAFLQDVVAPAELPTSIMAYKNQQARWAKGSIQCLIKFAPEILTDRTHSLSARLYALASMSAYTTHLLLLVLLLLQIPLLLANVQFSSGMLIFTLIGIGQPLLFVLAQQILYADWPRRLRHFPTMLLVAIGIAPSNSRAILEAVSRQHHPFVRTPKGGGPLGFIQKEYRFALDKLLAVELLLALYALVGLGLAVARGNFGPLFLLGSCALGFGYVAFLEIREQWVKN